MKLFLRKGDVLVIPAGVAHKNLGNETEITCIGGYPDGRYFDLNTGSEGELGAAVLNIAAVPLPATGPIYGRKDPLLSKWNAVEKVHGLHATFSTP